MRILYLIDSEFPFHSGGIETYLISLAGCMLRNYGAAVEIFSMKTSKSELLCEPLESVKVTSIGLAIRYPTLLLKRKIFFPLRLILSTIRIFAFILGCIRHGLKSKASLIHTVGIHASWISGIVLKLLTRRPLVITLHGQTALGQMIDYELAGSRFLSRLMYALTIRLEKFARNHANLTIGLYPHIADMVTPQGVQTNRFILAPDNKKNILFVGRLTAIKGVHKLIDALSDLRDLDITAIIVGDGPERPELEESIRTKDLSGKIKIVGWSQNVNEFLSRGGILVLPSLFEGFPASVLEGMCSGLPTIVTRVGALPHFFRNGQDCIMVEPNSATQLSHAILLLYKNDELRNTIRLNARKRVMEEFSWDAVSKKIYQAYISLLSAESKNVPRV